MQGNSTRDRMKRLGLIQRPGTPVLFRLRCPGSRAYLSLAQRGGGRREMIQLRPIEPDEWEVRLRLPPASYRYHYYVDDGETVSFYPADCGEDAAMDGWGCALEVPDLSDAHPSTAVT
jgi:hypothetical protein